MYTYICISRAHGHMTISSCVIPKKEKSSEPLNEHTTYLKDIKDTQTPSNSCNYSIPQQASIPGITTQNGNQECI